MTPNRLYPGKPNYRGPKSGYFTLLHHLGPLVEWSDNVMERVEYIKSNKAAFEIPIRLRHIVFVPKKMQPKALQKAYADWRKANADWRKADADRRKAYADWRKAYADWQKADADREKADANWQKAGAVKLPAYLHKHATDCKWNGKEIVFKDAP